MEHVLTETARPLSIGGHAVRNRAFLAPMAGITDRPFREIAERFGAGMVVSEMIASAALGTGHQGMARKLGRAGSLSHMVQIAGCVFRWMAESARLVASYDAVI